MIFIPYHSSSSGNLYSLSNGDSTLLIEAGLTINKIRKALNHPISGIRACLASHGHGDHSKGCKDLASSGIDVYATSQTFDALKLSGHRCHIIEPLKQFKIDDWTVLAFPTEHNCPGSVGFLIESHGEKMVFVTDSFYCRYKFKGLNIIAIEANWSEETISPNLNPAAEKRTRETHFSLERAIEFLKANDLSKVREIHLLHLSDSNSDEALFKQRVQQATGKPVYIASK
jgi:phosphoribosyl 1,2-cyclic phosphodiesterase